MKDVFNGAQLGLAMQLVSFEAIIQFQAARGENVSGRDGKMSAMADFLEELSLSIRNAENDRKEKQLIARQEQEQARIGESRERVKMLTSERSKATEALEAEIANIVAGIPANERTPREAKLVAANS